MPSHRDQLAGACLFVCCNPSFLSHFPTPTHLPPWSPKVSGETREPRWKSPISAVFATLQNLIHLRWFFKQDRYSTTNKNNIVWNMIQIRNQNWLYVTRLGMVCNSIDLICNSANQYCSHRAMISYSLRHFPCLICLISCFLKRTKILNSAKHHTTMRLTQHMPPNTFSVNMAKITCRDSFFPQVSPQSYNLFRVQMLSGNFPPESPGPQFALVSPRNGPKRYGLHEMALKRLNNAEGVPVPCLHIVPYRSQSQCR